MKTIYTALSYFQKEVGTINKDSKGYGYKYASLENIVNHINPILDKYDLGFTQLINGDSIKTILFHTKSAEVIESNTNIPNDVELKGQNAFQVLGSAISYLRRYSLVSLSGIVTDEDVDAATKTPQLDAKTIKLIQGKIAASLTTDELTTLYNSDVRIKTNKQLVDAFKQRNKEITQ